MNRQMHYRPVPRARVDAASLTSQDLQLMGVMNAPQAAGYRELMSNTPRPTGGFVGCGYLNAPGFSPYNGVSCQYGSLSQYHPNLESFHSDWVANVSYPYSPEVFMYPQIQAPANLPQIFLGGGAGFTPCREDCACSNMNPDCKCKTESCGYSAIHQDCTEPVLGGEYRSLAECEFAREMGYTTPNPQLEALMAQSAPATAAAAYAAAAAAARAGMGRSPRKHGKKQPKKQKK